MSTTCICRHSKRWIFATVFALAIAYHTLIGTQVDSLRAATYRLPFTKDPPAKTSNLQEAHAEPQLQHDDTFGHDASTLGDVLHQDLAHGIVLDTSKLHLEPSEPTEPTEEPSITISSTTSTEPISYPDGFIHNAHSLASPDAFLPHFSALPILTNFTVPQATGNCQWTAKELTHFQFGEDAPWRVGRYLDIVIAFQRHQWQYFIQNNLISWSSVADKFDGRGIIIVAGHPKSIKRVKVVLRSLLALGSTVPVELHYFGNEIDGATKSDLLAIYHHPETKGTHLYFNDLASPDQVIESSYNLKIKINYNLKTAAIINSRFAEPLLLDSDNIPAVDPALLWESQTYKRYGSVFWPDFARTRPEHPAWAITNTPCRRDEYEFETGQVLVDKRRFFYHLSLAAFWAEQPYWHDLLLGDKDLFRYAWHALKTEYGTPHKWITSIGFLQDQEVYGEIKPDYCGHTFAQHHPDARTGYSVKGVGKSGIAFFHGGTLKAVSAPLLTRLRENNGGIFTHYKRSPYDEDWSSPEYLVGLRYWSAGFYYNMTNEPKLTGDEDFDKDGIPIGLKDMSVLNLTDADLTADVMCTDWGEVEAKPINQLGEQGFEQRFEDAGGYWMIEDGYRWGKSGA